MRCTSCGAEHPAGTLTCPVTGESLALPGPVGGRVDRYAVERLLGAGGFGAVYRARHVHTDQPVALKVLKRQLSADPQMIDRFLREAKAAASIGDPHIVRVMDAGVAPEGVAFLAMELLEGCDLKELSVREGPLGWERLVRLGAQVLDGLAVAHARGIVHRDMKPANVFVVRDAEGNDFAKLLDFGISKMVAEPGTSGLTMTGVAMGTPSYMAPEQFFDARGVDGRADLYSVSVMLYELLAGRLPFDAQSYAELIVKVKTERPASLAMAAPQLPASLSAAVDKGLSREAADRHQTAAEYAHALREAAGLPSSPSPGQPAPQPLRATATPAGPWSAAPPPQSEASALFGATATPTPAGVRGILVQPPPSAAPLRAPATAQAVSVAAGVPAPAAGAAGTHTAPKSNSWKWVVGILGGLMLTLGCCVCSGLLGSARLARAPEQAEPAAPAKLPAPEVRALPPLPPPPPTKPDAKRGPKAPKPPRLSPPPQVDPNEQPDPDEVPEMVDDLLDAIDQDPEHLKSPDELRRTVKERREKRRLTR